MNVIRTAIADVLILEPKVFGDARGFFLESWNAQKFNEAIGREVNFVQDSQSRSRQDQSALLGRVDWRVGLQHQRHQGR